MYVYRHIYIYTYTYRERDVCIYIYIYTCVHMYIERVLHCVMLYYSTLYHAIHSTLY